MKYAITIYVLLFLCKACLIISADTTETNSPDYRDYNPELVQDFADVVTAPCPNGKFNLYLLISFLASDLVGKVHKYM